jgi:hypothetical protein
MNESPVNSDKQVMDYKAELNKLTTQVQETEKPSGMWVSFKGGQLVIGGNPQPKNKAEVVIVHSVFENQLYKDRYDPNNPQSPMCYAIAENDEELVPHPDAAVRVSPEGCKVCPNNEWKSDPNGGKGKACKNVRRLALISASDLETIDKAEVAIAKLPVTSVKNWSTYASQIANVLKLPPLAVITEISVEPDAKTQFQVNFQLVDKIEDGAVIQALLNKRRDITPLMFSAYDPVLPQAEPQAQRKF